MATRAKRERVVARVTPEQKALFQRAAQIQGQTLTDFVVDNLQEIAEQVINGQTVMRLSARDNARFVEALLNPSPPNEHLVAAANRHHELIIE